MKVDNVERVVRKIELQISSDEPRIVCNAPGIHDVPLMLFVSTVFKFHSPLVRVEALINGINDDKSMISTILKCEH